MPGLQVRCGQSATNFFHAAALASLAAGASLSLIYWPVRLASEAGIPYIRRFACQSCSATFPDPCELVQNDAVGRALAMLQAENTRLAREVCPGAVLQSPIQSHYWRQTFCCAHAERSRVADGAKTESRDHVLADPGEAQLTTGHGIQGRLKTVLTCCVPVVDQRQYRQEKIIMIDLTTRVNSLCEQVWATRLLHSY